MRDPLPEHCGLPITYHWPGVWKHRTAYRFDPLLAATNRPLAPDVTNPRLVDGRITGEHAVMRHVIVLRPKGEAA